MMFDCECCEYEYDTATYRQCRLRKDYKDGSYTEQVSYIPEPFCKEGRVLKLRDPRTNTWDNGWVVTWVSEHSHTGSDGGTRAQLFSDRDHLEPHEKRRRHASRR